eukprot:TRINITY_DN7533_c0_g1_i2.p1 TRINITY_DN7533_c0_g1~~TRINITY_DN7533_c0_g1_i2.p1  ORF type:complete len:396 (-),score=152.64 TRINITY_DN7533_c0_g1_i2:3-1127(-)
MAISLNDEQREKFLVGVPKVELHVHLEGTLSPSLLFSLAKKNGLTPEGLGLLEPKTSTPITSAEKLQEAYQSLENLDQFLSLYYSAMKVLRTEEDFFLLAKEHAERLLAQHVQHVEFFFDPQAHSSRGVEEEKVVRGIVRGLEETFSLHNSKNTKNGKVTFGLIACFVRDRPVEEAEKTFSLLSLPSYSGKIIGFGLDSDEMGFPPSLFKSLFQTIKAKGYRVVGHGGHDGPARPYVAELLADLHVERIDHGITIVDDDDLVKEAQIKKVPFTVCPISNVKIGPVPSLAQHPIKKMIELGLNVTINSDDPIYLCSSLTDNLVQVANILSLSFSTLVGLIRNSISASFVDEERKKEMSTLLDNYVQHFLTENKLG